MAKYFSKTLFIALAFVSGFCVAIPAQAAEPIDGIVVIINNDVITKKQLMWQLQIAKRQIAAANVKNVTDEKIREQVLNLLINNQLQMQEAKKRGITVGDEKIDQAVATIAKRNNITVSQMQQAIVQQGLNFKEYKEQLRKTLLINALQQQVIGSENMSVTTAEVEAFQKEHPQVKADEKTLKRAVVEQKIMQKLQKFLSGLRSQAYIKIQQ